jgi:RNA polymerase sigma factor (sigma-70 family)
MELGRSQRTRPQTDAARKRAAVELVARHEATLKRTARRYSLDEEDAEDAYQRALEIVLTKAPTTDPRELIRWTQTVTKHEALAVRQSRERLLGRSPAGRDSGGDAVASIPALSDPPDEQAERRESVARSREALLALKPAQLRALTLLAQGYSYAEIGELTGFSPTKINRLLAEGRERFRHLSSSSEDGTRCRQLRPLLSAFCDGEVSLAEEKTVREHLRACAGCRSTMKAYRSAPRIAIALFPALRLPRSLLGRLHDLLGGIAPQMPSAKLLTACAATAGGAACLATGVVPTPLDLSARHPVAPAIERSLAQPLNSAAGEAVDTKRPEPTPAAEPHPERTPEPAVEREAAVETAVPEAEAPAYEAPAAEPPPPAPTPSPEPSSGSAAGEFGP